MSDEPILDIKSAPAVWKPRKLKMDWSQPLLSERSAVDRMAAVGRGEPDPGPDLPSPVQDLLDLWGTSPEAGIIEEALKLYEDDVSADETTTE